MHTCSSVFSLHVSFRIMVRKGRSRTLGKRSAGWFKKDCTAWNKGLKYQPSSSETAKSTTKLIKRVTYQEFARAFKHTDSGEFVPIAEGVLQTSTDHSPGGILRPQLYELSHVERALKERTDKDDISGYTEVHLPTCVNALQDCIVEHGETNPGCTGRLVTAAKLVTKWGVSAIIQLGCNMCSFVSEKQKLFREVPHTGRGRKSAEPNRSLAVGLFATSIGTAGAQRLLSSMNKTIPAPSSMQRQLNKVGDIMRTVNDIIYLV